MATIGHLAAGAVCGAAYSRATGSKPVPAIAAFAALAVAPDLDLLIMPLVPPGSPLAHRVVTHSLPFAVVAGAAVGLVGTRGRSVLLGVMAGLALASHGLLDALTRSGLGPTLSWPLSQARADFGWRPIPGQGSYQEYFTWAAAPGYAQEFILHLPLIIAAALIILWPRHLGDPTSVQVGPQLAGAAEDS